MYRIVSNKAKPKVTKKTVNNRQYLIVHAVLIVPGVLKGMGDEPLYYPAEECEVSANSWNGTSVVVYHPTKDGYPVSARTPDVWQSSEVGRLWDVEFSKGKLRGNVWLDVERLEEVDPRILEALEAGDPVEISTGLYLATEDAEPGSKDSKGREYEKIATNFRPDHLAILPDQKGACSLEDGCGLLANSSNWQPVNRVKDYLPEAKLVINSAPECRNKLSANAEYAVSYQERMDSIRKQLDERFGYSTYVSDMYDDSIIFSWGGKTWKLAYSEEDGECVLSEDEPTKVKRITHYEPTANTGGGTVALTKKQRAEIINHLTANCECWGAEGDAEILAAFTDEKLESLKDISVKEAQILTVANSAVKGFRDPESGKAYRVNPDTGVFEGIKSGKKKDATAPTKPKANAEDEYREEEEEETPAPAPKKAPPKKTAANAGPQTMDEWFRSAPEGVRKAYQAAESVLEREKAKIVAQLTANMDQADAAVHRERLMKRDLDDLAADLEMMPKSPPPETEDPKPAANRKKARREEQDDDMLGLPSIDWSNNGKGKAVQNQTVGSGQDDLDDEPDEDGWLQNAPSRIKQQVLNAQAIQDQERKKLLQQIIGNVKDPEAQEQLAQKLSRKSLEDLQTYQLLQGMSAPPKPERASYWAPSAPPAGNRGATNLDEDLLELPKIDWKSPATNGKA